MDHFTGTTFTGTTVAKLDQIQVMAVLKAAGVEIDPVAVDLGVARVSGDGPHVIVMVEVIRTDRA